MLAAALLLGHRRGHDRAGGRPTPRSASSSAGPSASFQAVKHLLADMLVRAEVARAAVYAAGVTLDDPTVGDPDRAVAAAKLMAGEAAVANGKACIQVHGGMGFTWEVDAHLYLKRAGSSTPTSAAPPPTPNASPRPSDRPKPGSRGETRGHRSGFQTQTEAEEVGGLVGGGHRAAGVLAEGDGLGDQLGVGGLAGRRRRPPGRGGGGRPGPGPPWPARSPRRRRRRPTPTTGRPERLEQLEVGVEGRLGGREAEGRRRRGSRCRPRSRASPSTRRAGGRPRARRGWPARSRARTSPGWARARSGRTARACGARRRSCCRYTKSPTGTRSAS